MNATEKILEIEKFKKLTPIQEAIENRKDKNRDFIGISSTGSGKSHAFFLAVFDRIDPELHKVQAVISVPTRELAYQLNQRIKKLCEAFGVRSYLAIGGTEKKDNLLTPQIVIGTPGRLKDLFLEHKTLRLNEASLFIIDEADMTMEFGFLEDIDEILSHMSEDTTVMVFSATIPQMLQPFLKKYLKGPEIVQIDTDQDFQADIRHILVDRKHMEYGPALKQLLKNINPYVCLIFANSTREAASIANELREDGYDLVELHGDLEARERSRAIREIQSQKKSYIVASDLASRGIDLEGITHVISLGFPKDLTFYHHRAGRTGRAGRNGTAYTLYNQKDEKAIETLSHQGVSFERMELKGGKLAQEKTRVRKGTNTELKEQIKKISGKKRKVKPNYKKKHRQEVDNLRRKQRRAMIKEKIALQKKERAKAKQREKNAK